MASCKDGETRCSGTKVDVYDESNRTWKMKDDCIHDGKVCEDGACTGCSTSADCPLGGETFCDGDAPAHYLYDGGACELLSW